MFNCFFSFLVGTESKRAPKQNSNWKTLFFHFPGYQSWKAVFSDDKLVCIAMMRKEKNGRKMRTAPKYISAPLCNAAGGECTRMD